VVRRGREPLLFRYSIYAAWIGGVALPALESVRRWGTGNYLFWVDDYLIGAALVAAAWRAGRDGSGARPWLAAAWAFACGIGYSSFLGHWLRMDQPDVGRFDHRLLTGAIGLGLLLALLALYGSLKPGPDE
jgi:hypothetical protein